MPVLHAYADGSGHYAKSQVQGTIVTFQLLAEGVNRLRELGVGEGDYFSLRLLGQLCDDGQAFTTRARRRAAYVEAEQFEFHFE
jgi:hypothetical protein